MSGCRRKDIVMKIKNKHVVRCLSVLFASVLAVRAFAGYLPSYAAEDLTETVNLTRPQKNVTGEGYYWDNHDNKLILQGINLSTSDEYGIKLIDGAIVELRGDNYISASVAALAGQGSFTIVGDGKLTVETDGDGIMSYSTVSGEEIKIRDGKIEIKAGGCGIRCDTGTVSIVGGEVNISVSDMSQGSAVSGKYIQLTGGELNASAPIVAERTVRIIAAELTAEAEGRAVLSAGENISFEKVDMQVGDTIDSLSDSTEYVGQSAVSTKSNAYRGGTSAILGEGFPRYADILLVMAAILLLLAIVLVPILNHRRRTKALIRRLEAEKSSGKQSSHKQ